MTDHGLKVTAQWGAALRAARIRRKALVRRGVMLTALAACVGVTIASPPRPWLVWNVSSSAPIGLYAVGGRGEIAAGDMVIARVPARWRSLAARRHYIPANVPLVKRVAAVPGDRVCALDAWLWVENRFIAERRAADALGRPIPRWSGCLTLQNGSFLLLMDDPASFDGRYFGVTGQDDVIGEATALWTR